jgi:hypothetical protein
VQDATMVSTAHNINMYILCFIYYTIPAFLIF